MSIKRQSVWNMLPQLVAAAAGVFTLPFYRRYLGDDMNALWLYVSTLGGMFGFADLGLGVSVGRYLGIALGNKDRDALKAYWGTGNAIIVPFLALMAAAFVIIGFLLGSKWFHILPENLSLARECFIAGGFSLFFSYYSQYWNILTQAHLDFKFIGILRVICTMLQVIPALILAAMTKNPFLLVAWGAAVALFQLAVFVWHGKKNYDLGFHFESACLARAREMSAYIGKNFLGLIAGSAFGQIDRLILGRFAGSSEFVNYSWASRISGQLQGLSVSVMGPVFFHTARAGGNRNESSAKIYNDTFQFVFDWYLLAALWIVAWHPVLLRLWLANSKGGQFIAGVSPLMTPLVIACCFMAVGNISSAQLSSINRLGAAIGFQIAGGLLTVAGVWTGWHYFGVLGAAYGFLFGRIANIAQDLFAIRLLKAGGWMDIRTWKKFAAQGCIAGIFATGYFFVRGNFNSYWLLLPAALHGGLVTAWILRNPVAQPIRPFGIKFFQN